MMMRSVVGGLVAGTIALASAAALADGDADAGKKVFNKCKACHVADEEKNRVGPHLVGIFGRTAGAVEDFKYSDAMKGSGVVWDETTIAEYMRAPKDFIPQNRMAFAGLKKDDDIENLIAYLQVATAP